MGERMRYSVKAHDKNYVSYEILFVIARFHYIFKDLPLPYNQHFCPLAFFAWSNEKNKKS